MLVRIPMKALMSFFVSVVCSVGSDLCDEVINGSEEAYRVRVCLCV
jgi:hypothetical protein